MIFTATPSNAHLTIASLSPNISSFAACSPDNSTPSFLAQPVSSSNASGPPANIWSISVPALPKIANEKPVRSSAVGKAEIFEPICLNCSSGFSFFNASKLRPRSLIA